ncbi:hypothetical protein [Pseudoxanthomonas indica]|uniref:Uncharacterized protein n=1 Tax=Pseudoxanthomonas indica TaxID=428993 RepID=A0A1T5M162_9GAMM|nr:hypothetical protein [Pseudoxanthomonas indica]GGD60254.1 hypothetical protein GCM10007235_35530 [Pseudoxanthomonas indica]SKC81990.1 hypothetical protein SAMN06296058_3584 [Pseudoxanthomonas indica]
MESVDARLKQMPIERAPRQRLFFCRTAKPCQIDGDPGEGLKFIELSFIIND